MIREHEFSSPLGPWRVAEADAPADLRGDVLVFWEARGFVGAGYEKIVPRGGAELIFNLAGPQAMYGEGRAARASRFHRVWLTGLFDRPLFVGPAYDAGLHGTHLVAVSLSPAALATLFGLHAGEFRNGVLEADEIFGPAARAAWNRVGEAATTAQRFHAVAAFLRACRDRLARPAPFDILWAMRRTAEAGGAVSVAALCGELSVSRKHLAAQFKRVVGATPKAYARLARFRAAMALLEEGSPESFAAFALDAGYADQAHFIREFARFAGEPPSRFLANRSADGETVLFADGPA